jgi:hypothetical protein
VNRTKMERTLRSVLYSQFETRVAAFQTKFGPVITDMRSELDNLVSTYGEEAVSMAMGPIDLSLTPTAPAPRRKVRRSKVAQAPKAETAQVEEPSVGSVDLRAEVGAVVASFEKDRHFTIKDIANTLESNGVRFRRKDLSNHLRYIPGAKPLSIKTKVGNAKLKTWKATGAKQSRKVKRQKSEPKKSALPAKAKQSNDEGFTFTELKPHVKKILETFPVGHKFTVDSVRVLLKGEGIVDRESNLNTLLNQGISGISKEKALDTKKRLNIFTVTGPISIRKSKGEK